eukprot:g4592.t1
MGSGSSVPTGVHERIRSEFASRKSVDRKYLILTEVLALTFPKDIQVNFMHLGTLYVLDKNKDGRFTLDELLAFAKTYVEEKKKNKRRLKAIYKEYAPDETKLSLEEKTQEFPQEIFVEGRPVDPQGSFTLLLLENVTTSEGREKFADWFCRLFEESNSLDDLDTSTKFMPTSKSEVKYVHCDAIATIYSLLKVRPNSGLELQQFIDLVQQAAEEIGLLDLDDDTMDDLVPIDVIRIFALDFIRGFRNMMEGVNYT